MRQTLASLLLICVACAHQTSDPVAPATARESGYRAAVFLAGNRAGSQVVTIGNAGETVVDFEFADRGRGPKTHTVMRVDDRALPTSVEISGNDYLKTPIEERFSLREGKATWTNTAEKGTGASGSFYTSMYGPPEELAALVRAALRSNGRVSLYPSGEARVRRVGELTLRGTRVHTYELSGLGFTPFELWLTDDLQFFASASSWMSTIREGFESDLQTLIDAQDARDKARTATLAQRLARVPTARRLTILNARVFDPRTGTLSAPTTINVEGTRIASIGVPQERNAADILDASGKVVLPGLWDMHTHLGSEDGLLHIAAGVTSVRDLGNDPDTVLALRKSYDDGSAIGPRIALAGLIDGPGPFQGPTKMLAANEADARRFIDYFAEHGYTGIKIYSSIVPELVPVLTSYAHQKGLRVSGHIPAGMRASDAVQAGYDEIQHANMLMLNFMPDVKNTRTPARFTEVGKRGADLDLQSAEVREFIAMLRDRKIVIDPTVAIFEGMFTARAGTMSPVYAAIADRLPPQVRRGFLTGGLPVPEGMDARYRASYRRMLDLIAEMHRQGVTVVAGTDAMAGFALHRELELYAEAGIPNADVLRIATLNAARVLGRDQDLGTIEAGKLADFVLVDGNPLERMSDIRRIVTIVKDGKVYDAKELYAELGVSTP
jgi:imidazolonepropionase-like amidohydrolase